MVLLLTLAELQQLFLYSPLKSEPELNLLSYFIATRVFMTR